VQLLVWIFVMRVAMLVSSSAAYFLNGAIAKAKYANSDEMDFETPLTSLVWMTSIVSIILTYIVSYLMIPDLGDGTLWWKLASIISCGTLAGALIPELVKVFTSTKSIHVKEVVKSAQEGGASLGILSGFVAGNFSAYWLGLSMVALMAWAITSALGIPDAFNNPAGMMLAPAVFAFGLVAFGFLGMGPVTIAVDSYGPVTDNAQSVYELSLIENCSRHRSRVEEGLQHRREVRTRKIPAGSQRWSRQYLQGYGQAGADRHRRGGRNHHDFLDHHGPDPRTDRDVA
jgi:K(+)-stimulated pyrophosphate-energized sodium pump